MEKKYILNLVAKNLRDLMNQKGLSNTDLARKCSSSTGTISKIIHANMSITIPLAINIAKGLGVGVEELLVGLTETKTKGKLSTKMESNKTSRLFIGVLSINNKRITCVKNHSGKIIGSSELEGGLDLAETSSSLLNLINESIHEALSNTNINFNLLKQAHLNLVTQSYEFEETRYKFILFAKKYFKEVLLLPDWQVTYFKTFDKTPGISLITDKGVSLSYKYNGVLKKLGGWKFPVYDLGGENWLGVETIRHTIEAVEGYLPMSELAHNVLAKFNGKIEKITETCFKGTKDADIYCLFSDMTLRNYLMGESSAKEIIQRGFQLIYRSIERVDTILGHQLKILLDGSLSNIYKPFFKKERLIAPSTDTEKAKFLADITKEFLAAHGIKQV